VAIIKYEGPEKFVEIKMLLHHSPNHAILLVEGFSDSQVYSKFVDSENCDVIFFDNDAVNKVVKYASRWNQEFTEKVIGIIDADCKHLNRCNLPKNVYKTDTRDLETLMMYSDSFEIFLKKVADPKKLVEFEKYNKSSLKLILIDRGKHLGYLECYSQEEELGLNFKDIDFEKFVDKWTCNIHFHGLLNLIKENTTDHFFPINLEEIEKNINKRCKSKTDLWLVCRGHDLTFLLMIGLRDVFGNSFIKMRLDGKQNTYEKIKVVEKLLHQTYSMDCFQKTKLFESIKNWEKDHFPKGILIQNEEKEKISVNS